MVVSSHDSLPCPFCGETLDPGGLWRLTSLHLANHGLCHDRILVVATMPCGGSVAGGIFPHLRSCADCREMTAYSQAGFVFPDWKPETKHWRELLEECRA